MCRSERQPFVVLDKTRRAGAYFVSQAQSKLRIAVALVGGLAIPVARFGFVLCNTITLRIGFRQSDHRAGVSLFSAFAVQPQRLGMILRNAVTDGGYVAQHIEGGA